MKTHSTGAGPGASAGAGSSDTLLLPRGTPFKWKKSTERRLHALQSNDNLVRHVIANYGLEEAPARSAEAAPGK